MFLSNIDILEALVNKQEWLGLITVTGRAPRALIGWEVIHPEYIQPASIDVHLAVDEPIYERLTTFMPFMDEAAPGGPGSNDNNAYAYIPMGTMKRYNNRGEKRNCYLLEPGKLYLAKTLEWVGIPYTMIAWIHGNSTPARWVGFQPHQQAGLLDPGYYGNPTLEITVEVPCYVPVSTVERPTRIGQVVFAELRNGADPHYKGRYQGVITVSGPLPIAT